MIEFKGEMKTVLCLTKCAAIYSLIFLFGSTFLVLYSCAGKSIKGPQELQKIMSEGEIPNDPTLSDEKLCKAAGDYAKMNGFNPPVCLYTNPEGEVKARPGGRFSGKSTPIPGNDKQVIFSVMVMMVNTGTKPIVLVDRRLKKGEVAFYEPPNIEIRDLGLGN